MVAETALVSISLFIPDYLQLIILLETFLKQLKQQVAHKHKNMINLLIFALLSQSLRISTPYLHISRACCYLISINK